MENKYQWHKWFAWRPVRIYHQIKSDEIVWLESIERKKIDHWLYSGWLYKLIGEEID